MHTAQRHVRAHHEGDGEVGGAPGGGVEGARGRAQSLGLGVNGEVLEAEVHGRGEGAEGGGNRSVLGHLQIVLQQTVIELTNHKSQISTTVRLEPGSKVKNAVIVYNCKYSAFLITTYYIAIVPNKT